MSTKVVVCQEELGPGLVDRVASAVSDGKIIVCPTDTLYALVADAKNSIAMDRIYVING
ncbi:MAG TPA: hypothetical protein EYN60_05100, partial [Nitrospirales bacterium]|nr:hypothetical protein [Nitrospirales bacterium]